MFLFKYRLNFDQICLRFYSNVNKIYPRDELGVAHFFTFLDTDDVGVRHGWTRTTIRGDHKAGG